MVTCRQASKSDPVCIQELADASSTDHVYSKELANTTLIDSIILSTSACQNVFDRS